MFVLYVHSRAAERHCTREREANSPIDRCPPLVFKSNTLGVSTFINVYYHSLDNESPINYHAPINGRADNESTTGRLAFRSRLPTPGRTSRFFYFHRIDRATNLPISSSRADCVTSVVSLHAIFRECAKL